MSKSCPKSAESVWCEKTDKELWSFMSGGMETIHLCQANHFGSSGSMDASGILSIFHSFVETVTVRPIN